MSRPKKYFNIFFFTNYKLNQYNNKIADKNIIFAFSSLISLSYSKYSSIIFKNYIRRSSQFFRTPFFGTTKQIILFFLFSLPIRIFSKNKKNIINLSRMDTSLIFKSHIIKHKFLGIIVEKNTGFILDLLTRLLIKRSKQISILVLNFLKSRTKGQNYIIKNQNKISNEIKFIINAIVFFLKIVKVQNFITNDTSGIKGSIIALAVKKEGGKVFEIFHGYHQASNLVGIFPINCDIQFHWTKELVDTIKKIIPKAYFNRYKFIGYPVQIKNKTYSNVLVLLPNLIDFNKMYCLFLLNEVFEIINFLIKFTKVVARPNPASKNIYKKKKYKRLFKKHGVILSDELDVSKDLRKASLVIGHDSTVLVTAKYNNIPSIMIKHYKSLYCDNVTTTYTTRKNNCFHI